MRISRFLPLFGAALLACGTAWADDAVRTAQETLRDLGFYNGEANGQNDAATQGAIRRFQMFKGLAASGTLDAATTKALHEEALAVPAAASPAQASTPPPASTQEEDRAFLDDRAPAAPSSAPIPSGEVPYAVFYRDTPYANAPGAVQHETLRRARAQLARAGLYVADLDGRTGPRTEEALIRYQSRSSLPRTGRLDMETLARLGLLPGGSGQRAATSRPAPRQGSTRDKLYYGRVPKAEAGAVPRGIRMD